MSLRRACRRDGQRGQGLVEFALVLPVILVLVLSVADLGFIFGQLGSLGYGSREGARTGAALARGGVPYCDTAPTDPNLIDPVKVDAVVVAAVQRVLESPDSGIDVSKIQEIRIFQANNAGEEAGPVNVWTYAGRRAGPDIDPETGAAFIDFTAASRSWPVCRRVNETPNPDSIGVTVRYTYDFVTPLPALVNAISGGALSLTLTETTVMALNPTTN